MIRVTTGQQEETVIFRDMEGRLNTALAQLEFIIPVSQPANDEYADTVEFVTNLTTTGDPITIIATFPENNINLEDFNAQPLRFSGEIHLAGQVFLAPIQLEGIYQNNELILDLEATITEGARQVAGRGVEMLQLYAHGVRIVGLTNE